MKKIELFMFDENPSIEEVVDRVKECGIVEIYPIRQSDDSVIAMTSSRYHKLLEKLAEGVTDNEV